MGSGSDPSSVFSPHSSVMEESGVGLGSESGSGVGSGWELENETREENLKTLWGLVGKEKERETGLGD